MACSQYRGCQIRGALLLPLVTCGDAHTGIALFAKPGLDEPPARGEIGITFRERPDAVQVLGQYDDGIDLERALLPNLAEGVAQDVNVRTFGE